MATRPSPLVQHLCVWLFLLAAALATADLRRTELIPVRKAGTGPKSTHSQLNNSTGALAARNTLLWPSVFGRQEEVCELPVSCAEGCCPAATICCDATDGCCEEGTACFTEPRGCCPLDSQTCGGWACADPGSTCCDNFVCDPGQICNTVDNAGCCEEGEIPCEGGCKAFSWLLAIIQTSANHLLLSVGCPEGSACASELGYCSKIGLSTQISTPTQVTLVTRTAIITTHATLSVTRTVSEAASSTATEDQCGGNIGKRRYPFPKDCPTVCVVVSRETMAALTLKDVPGETDDLIASTWYAICVTPKLSCRTLIRLTAVRAWQTASRSA
jgi:hypothetical protein